MSVPVKLIGYWRSIAEPEWPDPFDFVDDGWNAAERALVAAYLEAGLQPPWLQMGYSWCRFCVCDPLDREAQAELSQAQPRDTVEIDVGGVVVTAESCRPGELNGSREFTDGVYLWPEGLSHYVRDHGVRLPTAIVRHMQTRGLPGDVDKIAPRDVDHDWWKSMRPDW